MSLTPAEMIDAAPTSELEQMRAKDIETLRTARLPADRIYAQARLAETNIELRRRVLNPTHGTVLPKGSRPPRFQPGMAVRPVESASATSDRVVRIDRESPSAVAHIIGPYVDNANLGYKVPEYSYDVLETDTSQFVLAEDHVWCDAATVPDGAVLREGDRVPAFRVGMAVRDELEAGSSYSVVVGFEPRGQACVAVLEDRDGMDMRTHVTIMEPLGRAECYLVAHEFEWQDDGWEGRHTWKKKSS